MDYFSKFLRSGSQPSPKIEASNTLMHPDERQLSRGIKSTDVPLHLQSMVDALVWESTRTEEGGTGACLEYLLKNDVLGTLVKLSEADRPFGAQVEVLRAVQNMVVLLDEQFLVHSAVHKAVLRLLRNCVGDDIQEQLDGRNKVMGAAGNAVRSQPSEYEEDCTRIRTYRELLMIFFHDRQWYRPEPLFAVEEEDEEEEENEEEFEQKADEQTGTTSQDESNTTDTPAVRDVASPSPSQETSSSTAIASSTTTKKPEYEFLLFNYLLRFVHREGRIGDFARAGLLFLMDVAISPGEASSRYNSGDGAQLSSSASETSHSDPTTDAALALAEYIIDGDFSEVLAAGVSAVYSNLPSKLNICPPAPDEGAQSGQMVLGSNTAELSQEEKEKQESERDKQRTMGMEDSSNPDFKVRLDHFLKLLEFLQDILKRNIVRERIDDNFFTSVLVGNAIVQSILDAIRRVFLENVLYPAILECSDADGSAVAVMSYIDVMIRTLENGELADLLIDFLMSEDNTDDLSRSRARHQTLNLTGSAPPLARSAAAADKEKKLRRRKSAAMVLLEMEAPESRRQSEYFTSMGRFTLKDLLLSGLRSKSLPTATAALQLLRSLLVQYCPLCIEQLLIVIHDPYATSFPEPATLEALTDGRESPTVVEGDDEDEVFIYPSTESNPTASISSPRHGPTAFVQPETTYSTHEREMNLYLTLVSRVDPNHREEAFSTGYGHYLADALVSIQTQMCFMQDIDPETRTKSKHRLNPNDPLLSIVLESLRKFFSNTPEMNMALTGVLATLASCPDRSLAGWLTFAPKEAPAVSPVRSEREGSIYAYGEDGDDRSMDFRIEEKLASESHSLPATSIDDQSRPVVHSVFLGLVTQLEKYRQMVENFDQYLLERRQGLLFSENLTDALTLAIDLDPTRSRSASVSSAGAAPVDSRTHRPKSRSKTSFVSFLTPKKSKPTKPPAPEPATPPRSTDKAVEASPFGPHYQKTGAIAVEPFVAPAPSTGPWTPKKRRKWNADEEEVLGTSGKWGDNDDQSEPKDDHEEDEDEKHEKTATVTLSQLLDNVVILEESIKELGAIIHARRSLGIDSVRYL
ncbi:hypothetical protein WOLCODRAFT_64719 [Wolfiporia cocos MD-104 SS10]|uniref:FHF complex subunit HOOK-interacting protein C-terminal domain-containing protein n=1 Tax=Wolfiporia cocos (strain MD-104) TaxID=742152 RepID=A0A2H3JQB4_WOLCO|nr:hypothetical protein WOLCODRAFT_64719 [Wolfiporia cocos MD-104 SS10]